MHAWWHLAGVGDGLLDAHAEARVLHLALLVDDLCAHAVMRTASMLTFGALKEGNAHAHLKSCSARTARTGTDTVLGASISSRAS